MARILDSEQLEQIASRLLQRTSSGELEWESPSDYFYRVQVGKFGYLITSQDSDDRHPYAFRVFDLSSSLHGWNSAQDEMMIIETTSDDDLNQEGLNALSGLYESARRSMTAAGSVFNEIISDLDAN